MKILNVIFYTYAVISMIFFTCFLIGNYILYRRKKRLTKLEEILKDKVVIENNSNTIN
jgi:uncharacterized membrane protein YhfC